MEAARKCINSIADYMYHDESPLAAEDLKYSVELLISEAKLPLQRRIEDLLQRNSELKQRLGYL